MRLSHLLTSVTFHWRSHVSPVLLVSPRKTNINADIVPPVAVHLGQALPQPPSAPARTHTQLPLTHTQNEKRHLLMFKGHLICHQQSF